MAYDKNPPVWIYALVDPRDQSVRYVGRSRKPLARFTGHVSKGMLDYQYCNRRLYGWIDELASLQLRPMLLLIEKVEMFAGPDAEQKWIDHFRPNGVLYNSTSHHTGLKPVNRFRGDLAGYFR